MTPGPQPYAQLLSFLHQEARRGTFRANPDEVCTQVFLAHLADFLGAPECPWCRRMQTRAAGLQHQVGRLKHQLRWAVVHKGGACHES